jgi:hypothetical protein
MTGARHRPRSRELVPGLLSAIAVSAVLATTFDIDLPPDERDPGKALAASAISTACGPTTSATIAHVDDVVARRIYNAELRSKEVRADIAHITGDHELLTALTSADQATVYAAVQSIVYTPHWHIVRVRVVQNGRVLADVGGPDILAPISGTLHYRGRTVGHFVMSVQDDLGYVKLVSRFIGVPIDLYRGGSFVMGTLKQPPSSVSDGESVTVNQDDYRASILHVRAFPAGSLKVALFILAPASSAASRSCASVRLAAWGNVAIHIAARFTPLSAHYGDFRTTLQSASGGVVLVRSGSARLVGAGPAHVPRRGIVKYRRRKWAVFSWKPTPPDRIYFLTTTG